MTEGKIVTWLKNVGDKVGCLGREEVLLLLWVCGAVVTSSPSGPIGCLPDCVGQATTRYSKHRASIAALGGRSISLRVLPATHC